MYYQVRHVTQFRYSARVRESAMEVRMQPRREGRQQCLSFELTTKPSARIMSREDYLGNVVHHFGIPAGHTELVITAQSLVALMPAAPLPHRLDSTAWARLDGLVADSDVAEMLVPSQFAHPTPLLRELTRELSLERRDDPLTVLREITRSVHQTLLYMPESTKVDSPIDDALRQRRGVCQDFTHIMIALVRELAIPCRYVSGYLYRLHRDRETTGASATHAWAEALLPDLGWVGFDPTNNVVVADRHIRTAVGRDYADVPPTRGVFKGEAETELSVAVQVVPADETLAPDAFQRSTVPFQSGPEADQPQQQQQTRSGCLSLVLPRQA